MAQSYGAKIKNQFVILTTDIKIQGKITIVAGSAIKIPPKSHTVSDVIDVINEWPTATENKATEMTVI